MIRLLELDEVALISATSLLIAALVLAVYHLLEHIIFWKMKIASKVELLSHRLTSVTELQDVSETILQAVKENTQAKKVALMILKKDVYIMQDQYEMSSFQATIPVNHPITRYLKEYKHILRKGNIEPDTKTSYSTVKQIDAALDWLDVIGVVPFIEHGQLVGMLLVGGRADHKTHSRDAWKFLSELAVQASVLLERARLYKELQDYEADLKKEVAQATQELERANTQLRNLDKSKSEFLTIASHQLYTPLTALRGYISMLLEGDFGAVPKKQQQILELVNQSAMRLIELNKLLLDVSRIESGRLELNLQSVDLVEMAKELVQALLPNAMNKGLDLEFREPKSPVPPVVVDRDRLRQVMLNFVDNSIKYTQKGKIDVRIGREGDEVVFSVQDTGKGISRNDLMRLFNKFTRVGGASRFHTEGTGLGLYVARQIVKEHRGEIHVDSPGEGMGSTFAMSLPAEGTPRSLKVGEKAEVIIKAAEAQGERV